MGWPVCNLTEENETIHEIDLWDGGIQFHELCLIIVGAFAIIASLVSFYLIMRHATHYSKPVEQRHIIRILWMIPVYSLVAFLGTYYYKNVVYYSVLGDCYEAFAISAFFALLCHYIAPDLHSQKDYFRGIDPKNWVWPVTWLQKCTGGTKGLWRIPRSGLTWFNVIWVGVFQYCLLRVLMTIVAVVAQKFDLYCEESLNPAFAHLWVLLIECVAVTIAMYCLIQFYLQIKDDISQHSPFLKILSIKLVIFLSFWQSSVISFLFSSGAIKATKKLAAPDLKVGLPNLIIGVEMAFFSLLHLWAFPWKPYSVGFQSDEVTDLYGNGKSAYQGGRWGMAALLDALNPIDLIRAVGRSIRWLFVGRKKRTMDPSYQNQSEPIGLNPTYNTDTNHTSYEGAGAVLMTGGRPGRSDRYGSSPDEEGAVLLSNAQADPSSGNMGVAPPAYDEEDQHQYYMSGNRHNNSSPPGPDSHSARPFSPFEEVHHSSSRTPSDPDQHHYYTQGHMYGQSHDAPLHLQEQPPIPLPDDTHLPYDSRHGQR